MYRTLRRFVFLSVAATALAACLPVEDRPRENRARFNWFEYTGKDALFAEPVPDGHYQNPILAGFYPDPSLTRAGDDFYLVNSSFGYFPGIPIFHSTDLVNWRPLGHVLTRPEQLDLDGLGVSKGIFAPTIRFHDGVFYVITTAVDAGGNFLVTAEDPQGPWSDPVWLPEIEGIDPDLFFDDDGRVWIAHNGPPPGEPLYDGHRAIWLWEYDPATQSVVADSGRVIVNGGTNLSKKPIWVEGPHLFTKDGWYYLSCAQGGTSFDHSQVIFRSRDLDEPFVPYKGNPILTQRNLAPDRPHPVTSTGHADMIKTPAGEWWAVFLGTRTYDETYHNTGRETFLLPVTWRDGWPHILPAGQRVPYRPRKPAELPTTADAEAMTGNFVRRDEFDANRLSPHWSLLRTGAPNPGTAAAFRLENGALTLSARPVSLAGLEQPAFVARRQQHTAFEAQTGLALPLTEGVSAGLAAFHTRTHHYYLGVRRRGDGHSIFLERADGGPPAVIRREPLPAGADQVILTAEGDAGRISFFYTAADSRRTALARDLDARLLSTQVAGGFVGVHLGVHARAAGVGATVQSDSE